MPLEGPLGTCINSSLGTDSWCSKMKTIIAQHVTCAVLHDCGTHMTQRHPHRHHKTPAPCPLQRHPRVPDTTRGTHSAQWWATASEGCGYRETNRGEIAACLVPLRDPQQPLQQTMSRFCTHPTRHLGQKSQRIGHEGATGTLVTTNTPS